MEVYQRGDYFAVVGTLHDERPWAGGDYAPRDLHFMELGLVVRRADMTIVDAAADMQTFPHAECTDIEPSFRDLIGLSVARGYSGAVQERFGRQRGCSHLEFLARAIGPVVVQGITSSAAWQVEKGDGEHPMREGGFSFLTNTCHVWTEDGPGAQKIALGWRPGMLGYPAPGVGEVRRRMAEEPERRPRADYEALGVVPTAAPERRRPGVGEERRQHEGHHPPGIAHRRRPRSCAGAPRPPTTCRCPCAPRYSARLRRRQSRQLGGERGLQILEEQVVGGGQAPAATPGRRGCPADEGAPDLRDLLEERGPVRDGPFDPGRQRELGGQLRHVRPLAPELQGADELVEVVHVGEVVEHEAQATRRPAGPLPSPSGRVRRRAATPSGPRPRCAGFAAPGRRVRLGPAPRAR